MLTIWLTLLFLSCALFSGALPLLLPKKSEFQINRAILLSAILLALASLGAIVVGAAGILQLQQFTYTLPFGLPLDNFCWQLHLDQLAGFFLLLIGIITFAVSWFIPGYLRSNPSEQNLPALLFFTGIFIAGMQLVVLAANVFTFMFAWELMSIASYFLVAHHHHALETRQAALLYLVMAQISAILILISLGLLTKFSGSANFAAWQHLTLPPFWANLVFALALLGFGMKAGLVPMHVWLPQAHPVAPSHISALLSGVMLKIAVYGFIRLTFEFLAPQYWQWGVVVLIFGTVSALFGVLYALMQNDLKRLLAYSSVENLGIIFMGLGVGLIFSATHHPLLSAIGLVAALYHCINHALFKSLLFLGAGAVIKQTHSADLNKFGGIIHLMPWCAAFFLVGCVSIAALPPFNGFVSEWLTFQSLLQISFIPAGLLRILIPVAAATLALTAALAVCCFAKVFGITFLGKPRDPSVVQLHENSFGMSFAQVILSLLCLVFGVLPTTTLSFINAIPEKLLGSGLNLTTATAGWMWLAPIAPMHASYSAILIFFTLSCLILILYGIYRQKNVRLISPWDCGFGNLTAKMQYTSTAFAMPIRRIFKPCWQICEASNRVLSSSQPLKVIRVLYELKITDRFWQVLYGPWQKGFNQVSNFILRIQSGNLRAYLAYIFCTLIFLLWLAIWQIG